MRARGFRLAPILVLSATVLAAAPAQRQVLAGRGDLLLASTGPALSVAVGGRELPISLPAEARLETIAGETQGWAAAGTRPLAGARGTELVVATGDSTSARAVPPPGGRTARLRAAPKPVLSGGDLAGLLWLEGDDRGHFAVRAAGYDGERWSPSETVSPVAPGSQLALSVAVLGDGTWLAVWSRFNGHDDDVVWSTRGAGGWSEPRAVHAANAVPDITPAVLADGRGAWIAWNTFDGSDYRLEIARFDGGAVSAATTLGGPGWIFPDLAPKTGGDGALVRCLQADPQSWVVLDVDGAARVRRVASAAVDPTRGQPLLRTGSDHGVVVTWSGNAANETLLWRAVP